MLNCEVWVLVDQDGNYVASGTPEKLKELYEEEYQELDGTLATRLVKMVVQIPAPQPVVAVVAVPGEPESATVKVG